jgi:hypothetical protein
MWSHNEQFSAKYIFAIKVMGREKHGGYAIFKLS